ncbi:MAG: ion channel [Acidimicrobiales bacterium]|nr:ion channel [Acidimicrobiales bacterium]
MLVLSVAFVVLLLLPDLTTIDANALTFATATLWAIFGLEIIVLFFLAPSKRRMFRDHWLDIIIVAAPFLRPLRIGRIARVARTGGVIARSLQGVTRVAQRKGLQTYGAFTAVVVAASAALVFGLERDTNGSTITTFGDALWWAVVTVTTVGYGDHAPTTSDGRAVSTVLMFVGIGLVGVVTANVAAHFVEEEQADELASIRSQLDRIETLLAAQSRPLP